MTTLTEKRHAGSFIISEQDNYGSRDEITVSNVNGDTEMVLEAGTVLGKITNDNTDSLGADGDYVPLKEGQTDGSQTAAGILFGELTLAAGASAKAVNFKRLGQVRKSDLTWPSTYNDADITAALAVLAAAPYLIIARDSATEVDTFLEANS